MFRRMLVGSATGLAALLAVLLTASAASAAVRPFAAAQTVAGGCAPGQGDALVTTGGAMRGFLDCGTATGPSIRFVSRNADGSVNPSEVTGFTGTVLGMAYDSTASYVLFYTSTTIMIGKRTDAGIYSSRPVDSWGGVVPPTGDVIASGGQWFGVWSEQVGPGGEFAQTELFQAGTTMTPRQITGNPADDRDPSLAYRGSTPVMVWTRQQAPDQPGPADLRLATFVGGSWQSSVLATVGELNVTPDVATAGSQIFVTWVRDGRIVVASNPTGAFASHTFATPGRGPKVAPARSGASASGVFVTWTATGGGVDRVFFAETVGSAGSVVSTPWNGDFLTGAGNSAVGVGASASKATVVYRSPTSVFARTQS